MMRILLDTHVFLWYIDADPKLPQAIIAAIRGSANEVYLSTASVWEAVIKHQLGKLPRPNPPAEQLPQQRVLHGITSLPVDERVMLHLARLPVLHRDPFDRIILAQAVQHGMTIATVDSWMMTYNIPILLIS